MRYKGKKQEARSKKVFLCLLSSEAEGAKPRLSTAIVEGVAVITEGNPISARDSAIKNAMRIAVEDIVLNSVKEEGLEIYKESLEDNIYKNCEDFIQSYKI